MRDVRETLDNLSEKSLKFIEELITSASKEEILEDIHSVREARRAGINARILVENMVLDWPLLQKLKKENINTLQDIMSIGIKNIPGLYESEIEQLEWAVLFFDMRPLQNLPEDATQMDVAKAIIKQSKEANKVMQKKYGERYRQD